MATLLNLEFGSFVGDDADNPSFVAGDLPALPGVNQASRAYWAFDATDERVILTRQLIMPSQYTGSGLVAILHGFFEEETVAGETATMEVYVEAVNPGTTTLDMGSAKNWDTLNQKDVDPNDNTAGDPISSSVTLTNDASVDAGWSFRLGVRRDIDDTDDSATGILGIYGLELADDG